MSCTDVFNFDLNPSSENNASKTGSVITEPVTPGLADGEAEGDGLAVGNALELELVAGWQAPTPRSESRVRKITAKL